MHPPDTFADRLTALRAVRGVTTNKLAGLAGLTAPYLYRLQAVPTADAPASEVSLTVAARLASVLDPAQPAHALAQLAGLVPLPPTGPAPATLAGEKKSRKKTV